MKLDPNKTFEDNYRIWLAQQKENAKFFAEAWAPIAITKQPTNIKEIKEIFA